MDPKKQIVEWHDSYSVGIRLVDDQHKELINLTNRLHAASVMGWENSKAAFMSAIRAAVDYVGYHFSTEEKIMERINYPEYKVHKKEHTDFVKEVLSQVQDFQAGRKTSANDFVLFLRDWILAHVGVCDKKLGIYLIKLKKEGALSKMTMQVKKDSDQRVIIK
jgi:hemerythrin